jgi:transcriptional regulator with XRE-family HTH domain
MSRRSALRDRRLEYGVTQAELAARSGVSRQLIAAVEAGRNSPAVDAGLSIARALGTTVEELFAEHDSDVVVAFGDHLRDGAAIRVGRVGDQLVAAELPDHGVSGAAWAKADGVLDGGRLRLFPGASPAGSVLAGCDPAMGVAEAMLGRLGSRSLLAISAPTGTALRALQRGRVHAAVVHGRSDELPEPPVPVVRWHLARWRVGLAVPDRFRGHSFESILDAAAVTTEGAARAFDLSFISLEDHVVEVWIADCWLEHPGITALSETVATRAFTERVAHFGGYDMSHCGERVQAT